MSAPFTYLLPIRSATAASAEMIDYLRRIARWCPVLVVDGSDPPVFNLTHDRLADLRATIEHVPPDPELRCANAKVHGVLTGLARIETEFVVIADDDVRYTEADLVAVAAHLHGADVVIPQNYFDPVPWHARLDTGRTLLNRVSGGDFPGTLAARMSVLRATRGYDGDVLFENLELIRTVEAAGGLSRRLPGVYVRRLPPDTRHYFGQRVRQAYDEFARPARLMAWMCVLPLLVATCRRRAGMVAVVTGIVTAAEAGRRVHGGRRVFGVTSTLLAPVWVMERAVCIWLAVVLRARGGVRYSGGRIVRAASSPRRLRRLHGHVRLDPTVSRP